MTSPHDAKLRRVEYARGIRRLINATETRNHIHTLQGLGWSLRAIAGAADVSVQGVHRIARGRERINRITAAAVLAIPVDSLPQRPSVAVTEPFVSRIGTVRRIQGLLFMGWGHAEMTRRSGIATANALHQQGRWVTRSTHDKIATLYDELAMRPGPSTKAAAFARRLGYAPPLAWDDIDHDLVADLGSDDVDVDEVLVERVIAGDWSLATTANADERRAIVLGCLEAGVTTFEIARRTGWKPERYARVSELKPDGLRADAEVPAETEIHAQEAS